MGGRPKVPFQQVLPLAECCRRPVVVRENFCSEGLGGSRPIVLRDALLVLWLCW